jgi:hypothetical protein
MRPNYGNLRVDLYLHDQRRSRRDEIVRLLQELKKNGGRIMATIDDILTGVTDESNLDDSIILLLTNLKAAVDAAKGDQAKIDAAFAAITANKQKVSDAITANT